jgi:hypothetical protein
MAWRWRCRRCSGSTRSAGRSSCSGRNAQVVKHTAYKHRDLRIEYPWHPLVGRVLRACDGGRRRGGGSVLVEDRPGFFRTLPGWMCDPAYCARLDCGPPVVAVEALEALASALEAMRRAETVPSFSGEANPEEGTHATPIPTSIRSGAAQPAPGQQEPPAGSADEPGAPRDAGGAAAGCGEHDAGGLAR